MEILMEDEATHLGFADDALQELTPILLVHAIGVGSGYILLD